MHKQLQFEIWRGESKVELNPTHDGCNSNTKEIKVTGYSPAKKPLSYLQNLNTAWHTEMFIKIVFTFKKKNVFSKCTLEWM